MRFESSDEVPYSPVLALPFDRTHVKDLWMAVVSQRLCQDPGRSDNEELFQETFQNESKCEADSSNLVRPEVRKEEWAWVGG